MYVCILWYSFFYRLIKITQGNELDCSITGCHGNSECIQVSLGGIGLGIPTCVCKDGYTGELCNIQEERYAEYTSHCRNGGRWMPCYSETFDCHVPKPCICPAGYTGSYCQFPICENNVGGYCMNGVCDEQLGCLCSPGYYGNQCEYQLCNGINRCVHGRCASGTCQCSAGYTGRSCDEVDCNRFHCLNGAECFLGKCVCLDGYFGLNCEMKICPVSYVPCYRGDCTPTGECTCYSGYSGKYCQTVTCQSNNCTLFSTCGQQQDDGKDSCQCNSRYSGETCDIAPRQCGSNSFETYYCHNNANCDRKLEYCRCRGRYTGESCEEVKSLCGSRYCGVNQFCINEECCKKSSLKQCNPELQGDNGSGASLTVQSLPWYWTFLISMFVLGCGVIMVTLVIMSQTNDSIKDQHVATGRVQSNIPLASPIFSASRLTHHPLNMAVRASQISRHSQNSRSLFVINDMSSIQQRGSAFSQWTSRTPSVSKYPSTAQPSEYTHNALSAAHIPDSSATALSAYNSAESTDSE